MSAVVREDKDACAWLTLRRGGAANALSSELVAELHAEIDTLAGQPRVRAVVVTGADNSFCAGADLKERQQMTIDQARAFVERLNVVFGALERLPQLTIAAINGAAFGGGLELALACDLRIAVPAAQLGLTEVRMGIMPGAGGTQRLPRLVGHARAVELILLGQRISAQRALEIGLVHRVTDDLAATVQEIGRELEGCAPLGVAQSKRALRGEASERDCYEVVLNSADRNEGLRAFAEKRRPQFTGQ
jgi:enoyl-CoA hydratase